jgi:molybdopterin converting factor small subunit
VQANGENCIKLELDVYFYSIVADLVGQRKATWVVPAGTRLGDLIEQIAEQHPPFREFARRTDVQAGSFLRLFRNGQMVTDMDDAVADGDEVRIFPVISGG